MTSEKLLIPSQCNIGIPISLVLARAHHCYFIARLHNIQLTQTMPECIIYHINHTFAEFFKNQLKFYNMASSLIVKYFLIRNSSDFIFKTLTFSEREFRIKTKDKEMFISSGLIFGKEKHYYSRNSEVLFIRQFNDKERRAFVGWQTCTLRTSSRTTHVDITDSSQSVQSIWVPHARKKISTKDRRRNAKEEWRMEDQLAGSDLLKKEGEEG